ncbi:hypothetical protein BDW22DRAFT_1431109 [Trametopsis cervina]|nr:hypothetical protein BDW22DRAFT_1431109 [Trametopsis cervina]
MASVPSLGETLGVILVTGMLVAALYGVTTVQTFVYHQHSKHDPRILKNSGCYKILFLWLLDTIQFIFLIHYVYFYCVSSFGNFEALSILPWSIPALIITGAVSDVIVTGWFAHRLWKLSVNKWLILVIAVAALTVLGRSFIPAVTYPVVLTSSTLCGSTVGASYLTALSAVSIAVVVTFKMHPDKTYHFGFGSLLPKFLLNSLLAMLNSRELFKGVGRGDIKLVSIQLSHLPDSTGAQSDGARDSETHVGSKPHIKIHVDKATTESYQV